jgi:5'-3' exonuclease
MILIDFSNVLIANLHAQFGLQNLREVEEDLLRHMILNTLRSIRVKFRNQGELVIACDGRSWRREVFPYYKANRDSSKKKSDIDWRKIFEVFTKIREEVRENLPYRVVSGPGAEADDVISAIVTRHGSDSPLVSNADRIVIVSPDKDFGQLHRFTNVSQWDPIRKREISIPDPVDYLLEHVIRGDSGDGVPNVLSDDDTFVVPGKRQKTMTAKRLEALKREVPEEVFPKYERNQRLIDLSKAPREVTEKVLESFESEAGKGRTKIFDYFREKRLRNLLESIQEF